MVRVNKGDFFVVEFISLVEKDSRDGWVLTLRVNNLGVDGSYFDQCLKNCYSETSNVVVEGNILKYSHLSEIENVELYCEGVAKDILEELMKSPLWGKVGGPDLKSDYDKLD